VLSDSIGCNEKGQAQKLLPTGAGTARGDGAGAGIEAAADEDDAGAGPQIRWVGAQHLMHGYCGRAAVTGRAQVPPAGARRGNEPDLVVRPMALIESRRQRVVRIGPRALHSIDGLGGSAQGRAEGHGQTQTQTQTQTRARAA